MTGQETRNKLTDYWSAHDIKQGSEFAILTNVIARIKPHPKSLSTKKLLAPVAWRF